MDEDDRRFLLALARWRETKAPALAFLAGIRNLTPGQKTMTLAFEPRAEHESRALRMAVLDLAMLSDYALGAAARDFIGRDYTLPTMSLSLQLARHDAAPLSADGASISLEDGYIVSTIGTLRDGALPVGHCAALFAMGRSGAPPLGWEQAAALALEPLDPASLTEIERAAHAVIRAGKGDGRSWSQRLFHASCTDIESDPSEVRLDATTLLTNRSGGVQGGVLMALAERSAQRLAKSDVLASLHMDFVAAADVGVPLFARAQVLRAARRTMACSIELRQNDNLVAVATSLHRAT